MKSKGFSIVELMISILIASIVTIGLTGVLTSSFTSFGFSNASNNAVSAAHRVNVTLKTLLFQAGFINYRRSLQDYKFPSMSTNNWARDVVVQRVDPPDSAPGDAIRIRFFGSSIQDDLTRSEALSEPAGIPNGYIYNCQGMAIADNVMLDVLLFADSSGLHCRQRNLLNSSAQDVDVIIDPSIRFMALEFANSMNPQAGYVPYATYSALQLPFIDNVRYALVTSQSTQQKVSTNTNTSLLLFPDRVHKYTIPDSEKSNLHRVIIGTVALSNVMRGEH